MLNHLYQKFTAGRRPKKTDFKSSKFYTLLMDTFSIWCDFHVNLKYAVREYSLYDKIRYMRDTKLRDERILKRHKTIVVPRSTSQNDCFMETLKAMQKGEKAIKYAALWNLKKQFLGTAHLLEKVGGTKSIFGSYYYRVVLFKNALELKEHYALQAVLLNDILGEIQGVMPKFAVVVLRKKEEKVNHNQWREKLQSRLKEWELIKNNELVPETNRPPNASNPPWRHYANKIAIKNKSLVLIAASGWDVRAKLMEHGITNVDKAAKAGIEKISKILQDDNLAKNIFANSLAYSKKKPVVRQMGVFPPDRKKKNLYFDFETSDELGPDNTPHIYLVGLWDKEKDKYVHFLAKGKDDEEKIFRQFVKYVGNHKNVNLYHWTEYEVHELKKMSAKYPKLSDKLNKLILSCVDLKKIIQKAFYIPAPSFSLKSIAPVFGFNWRQNDCGAMDAMAYYWHWLETKNKDSIKKVLTYNEDDCRAMLEVDRKLEKIKPVSLKS